MEYLYKKASLEDLDLLTETRVEVLRAANKLDDSTDMSEVKKASRAYYEKALTQGTHTAYLVFDKEAFIGAGGVSYYTVMPTYHNPSGQKAYIMNMYTHPDYRRKALTSALWIYWLRTQRKKGLPPFLWKPQIWANPCMKNTVL